MKKMSSNKLHLRQCNNSSRRISPNSLMDHNNMLEKQVEYIENLQQQIYMLENEIGYLRNHLQENNKFPNMVAEEEKIGNKLAELQKEMQFMKIELKRKQTTIDLLRSEKARIERDGEELEVKFKKEKKDLLEELITLKKSRDSHFDEYTETTKLLQEEKQKVKNLQEDLDIVRVELDQLKREKLKDKDIINNLIENRDRLQKELYVAKMTAEAKPSEEKGEFIKELKLKIEELHEMLNIANRTSEHERLLRSRLSEDNSQLIKRHAELEAEMAEVKALLREEQSMRTSLEQIHLGTILEASEAKSRDLSLKEEIDKLNSQIKEECERCFQLTLQLSDEQRFKSREEEKLSNLQQRFEQKEERIEAREKENTELMRDKMYLNDQVHQLKQQLQSRDDEIISLKQKVQEMQISVEEFIQSNQAANRIVGERWKQLQHLAQSMQALTSGNALTES